MACVRHLNRLCTSADYSSPPSFQTCSDLSIPNDAAYGFLNDPIYAEDGNFMSPDSVEEERQKKDVPVLKVDPPSVHCKNLYRVTQHPTEKQMEDVARTALGNFSKVAQIEKWFAHRRNLEFLKSEARLKRHCGHVTPGVLVDVERLLRQLRGSLGINGQCTVSNLKRVLMNQGLCSNGPKPELVQRVYNYIQIIREAKGVPVESAEMAHVQDDSNGSDIVCAICLSGETSEGNDILICDGDHSTTVGYHQQCCVPLVACIPDSSWFCPECSSERRDVASELADPNYVPSSHPTTSASSTCSASSSASESDSNTSSDPSNVTSSSNSDSSDVSSLTSAS